MCSTESILVTIAAFLTFASAHSLNKSETYNISRTQLIQEEITASLGGKIRLTRDEIKANKILMKFKQQELDISFKNPQLFNFSKHFIEYKDDAKRSKVYQIIREMPKGGLLHAHSTLQLGTEMLRLTYEDHLYACYEDANLKFYFSESTPQRPCASEWTLLSDLRNNADNITTFDNELVKHFTLTSDDNKLLDADINTVWTRFNQITKTIKYIISYRPVREKFLYQILKNLYEDKVMYAEYRTSLTELYELNGTVHDKTYLVRLNQKVAEQFKKQHPDFVGFKLIVTKSRDREPDVIRKVLNITMQLKEEIPEMIGGFDVVGQEDLGRPLSYFMPILLEAKGKIDFFFHGGETNWFGMPTDENLYDAILLGTKRIGHAYALIKHPTLMRAVAKRNIALEVNLISNSVLSLVSDVRNHPLATYLALDLPVVLSSDDSGVWGADPLSHDFYVAFVGVASRHADLRMLKQLAINSIKYSVLDDDGKIDLYKVFNRQWNIFVRNVNMKYNQCALLDR